MWRPGQGAKVHTTPQAVGHTLVGHTHVRGLSNPVLKKLHKSFQPHPIVLDQNAKLSIHYHAIWVFQFIVYLNDPFFFFFDLLVLDQSVTFGQNSCMFKKNLFLYKSLNDSSF